MLASWTVFFFFAITLCLSVKIGYGRFLRNGFKIKKSKDILFGTAFSIYIIEQLLKSSLYVNIFPESFFNCLLYITLMLCIAKILFLDSRFTRRRFLAYCIITLITCFVYITSGRQALILQILLILASYRVSIEKIISWDMRAQLLCDVFIIISALTGIINNEYYVGRGYGLGFSYYSYLGLSIYAFTCCYAVLKYFRHETLGYIEIVALVVTNYLVYLTCGSKTPFYLSIGFVLGYIFVFKLKLITFAHIIWKWIATFIFPTIYILIFGIVYLYQQSYLDAYLTSEWRTMILRVKYSFAGISNYGIHLFGQSYSMEHGYYLDSGYVFVLVVYGVLFTLGLGVVYTMLFRYIYFSNQKIFYLWMLICLLGCMSTNFLLNVFHNPLLFCIPVVIENKYNRRIQRKNPGLSPIDPISNIK